jgi:hypothetical protein
MTDTKSMYDRVAREFTNTVRPYFETEETLKALWEEAFIALPFDRTSRWNIVLKKLLSRVWLEHGTEVKAPMTLFDILAVLRNLPHYMDFNILTQVFTNLQPRLTYAVKDAKGTRDGLVTKWEGRKRAIVGPKIKMAKVVAAEDAEYNHDLSTLRALDTILAAGGTSSPSFRVSPVGSTPALVDSLNFSSMGPGSDQFLQVPEGHRAVTITWGAAQNMLAALQPNVSPGSLATFYVYDLIEQYWSKSGGDILNNVMFTRYLTAKLIKVLEPVMVLPRLNSVMVIVPETNFMGRLMHIGTNELTAAKIVEHEVFTIQKDLPGQDVFHFEVHDGPRPAQDVKLATEPL